MFVWKPLTHWSGLKDETESPPVAGVLTRSRSWPLQGTRKGALSKGISTIYYYKQHKPNDTAQRVTAPLILPVTNFSEHTTAAWMCEVSRVNPEKNSWGLEQKANDKNWLALCSLMWPWTKCFWVRSLNTAKWGESSCCHGNNYWKSK